MSWLQSVLLGLLLCAISIQDTSSQEHVVLDSYGCADFLKDAAEPADGEKLLRSLMMISWAAGYAAAHQQGALRADPGAIQLVAATVGNACRSSPGRLVIHVVAEAIAQHAAGTQRQAATKGESASAAALKPGDAFRDCDVCPQMRVVPPGIFVMGSPGNEKMRSLDEGPQASVRFARPFAVGTFAVTFDEWDACVAAGGCNHHVPSDEGWGRGRRPVINVSWLDAKTYVEWLSNKSGRKYRLLSEAEREYVTRAGTTTPFWFGEKISTREANFDGNYSYGAGAKGAYLKKTVVVDSFKPNPWGLYQVHGNVWEWVEDCWISSRVESPADGSPVAADDSCSQRLRRGGSWRNNPQFLRAAVRGPTNADSRSNNIGFRVARDL
jgi:formylglycine-generating enzyme required for sulfatase activity